MPDLAGQFEQHLLAVSQEYTEITGTSPRRFLQMVSEHGGVETARILTLAIHPGEGFTRAWEHKCLHLTAEYLLVYGGDGAVVGQFEIKASE